MVVVHSVKCTEYITKHLSIALECLLNVLHDQDFRMVV